MLLNFKTIPIGKIYFNPAISRNFHSTTRLFPQQTNIFKNSPTVLEQKLQKENRYVQPYTYIRQIEGKMVNTKLYEGFNVWLDIPENKLHQIIDIVRTLREITSCVDDVMDNARTRRNIPSVNMIFSAENIICASFFVYTLALDAAADLGHPDAQKVLIKYLSDIYKGQSIEIYCTDNQYCLSEEEFEELVSLKTKGSLALPVGVMELFSKHKYDFQPFLTNLSRYIQILDDFIDLKKTDYTKHQISADDISAGRYTFPIMHALHCNPNDYEIKRILNLKTQDNEVKQHLISLLEKYGSIEYTRKLLNTLDKKVFEELNKLDENPIMVDVLNCFRSTANYLDK